MGGWSNVRCTNVLGRFSPHLRILEQTLLYLETVRMTANSKWDVESLASEAKKYSTRTEFARSNSYAYACAMRQGILDQICGHMVHRRQKLTPERVAQLAAACKTRSEFGKKHSPAYKKACDWGILDEVCAHMAHIGNHAIRAIYAIEFSDRSVYVGLTYNYDKRYSEHKNRKGLQKRFTSLTHYFRRFDEWLPIEEAKKKEAETIDEYRKNGWTILNRAKAGAVGVSIYSYDLDEVTKLVKYAFRGRDGGSVNPPLGGIAQKHQITESMV
jgi:predicted GIY-YIG superfamily endonuclease